jgi:hypothetical protein
MWATTFEARLRDWQLLRHRVTDAPKPECLEHINQWWFAAPWCGYYLHWDDRATWPDPWQLLEDNIFCSLARGLGMLYTISLLDRADIKHSELVQTENDNLVLIDSGKYVLNWDPDRIVNINPGITNTRHRVQQSSINHMIL